MPEKLSSILAANLFCLTTTDLDIALRRLLNLNRGNNKTGTLITTRSDNLVL